MTIPVPLSNFEPIVSPDDRLWTQEWYSWLIRFSQEIQKKFDDMGAGPELTAGFLTYQVETSLTNERVLTAGAHVSLDLSSPGLATISVPLPHGFLTWQSEPTLPNDRVLVAGANVTFDTSVSGQLTIAAAGAAMTGPFLTFQADATLPNDRVLTAGANVTIDLSVAGLATISAGTGVMSVPTKAALVTLAGGPRPADIKIVDMLGYWSAGDIGAARWRVTAIEPGHTEKLAWAGAWLELIPFHDGAIHFASFGHRQAADSGVEEDATPYLNKLFAYIYNVRRLDPSKTGGYPYTAYKVLFTGEHFFQTKPNEFVGAVGLVLEGTGNAVFYKEFVSGNGTDAIINIGSQSQFLEFRNIRWTVKPTTGQVHGAFITLISSFDTISSFRIYNCYFNSNVKVDWNITTNGLNGAGGVAGVRGGIILETEFFGGLVGSLSFFCTGGVDLIRISNSTPGGSSGKVSFQGQPTNQCSNCNLIGGAFENIEINHANQFTIATSTALGINIDFLVNFTISVGRLVNNIATTVNTIGGQFMCGRVTGNVNIAGTDIRGSGKVDGSLTVAAGSVWNSP